MPNFLVSGGLSGLSTQMLNNTTHQFITPGTRTNVALTSDALTIATTNYRHWDWFRRLFSIAVEALTDIYSPASFTRVGLRYVNGITPKALGLNEFNWSDLLNPVMLGELNSPAFASHIDGIAFRMLKLKLPSGIGHLLLRHGLNVSPDVQMPPDPTYTIDFDFSTDEQIGVGHEWSIIDSFHELSGRAFRWSINNRLHELLRPMEQTP